MKSNTEKGKEFQIRARDALSKLLGVRFEMEVGLQIGSPPKLHTFDLASVDRRYVGEAKAFTWTVSGNTPSAKITTLREAARYLQSLPAETKTFIVMKHDRHPQNGETLTDYFARLNDHLLGQVAVLEFSEDGTNLRTVRRGSLQCLGQRTSGAEAESETRRIQQGRTSRSQVTGANTSTLTASELGDLRRQLFRILDYIEGNRPLREAPGRRIRRLVQEGRIPRPIGDLMQAIVGFRNDAEYGDRMPTAIQAEVIWKAWVAITEWAATAGWAPK